MRSRRPSERAGSHSGQTSVDECPQCSGTYLSGAGPVMDTDLGARQSRYPVGSFETTKLYTRPRPSTIWCGQALSRHCSSLRHLLTLRK